MIDVFEELDVYLSDIEIDLTNYMAGLKGTVSVGVVGLNDIFDAGSFEDYAGTFSASFENSVTKPVVIAVAGITFPAANSADYGVNVAQRHDELTDGWNYTYSEYYTFVDGNGDPQADVMVQRQ